MIRFEDVWLAFEEHQVLRGVSFQAAEGKITALVGASGSGKSTILKLLIGFLTADRGRIVIDGEDVTGLGERQWAKMRRKMGMVFQDSALFDSLDVCMNVGFYPHFVEKQPWRKVLPRVMELLKDVGLEHDHRKMPGELSGGMQRRVALARSLIYHPKILLYDEPTTGLDPGMIEVVNELILEMGEKYGVTSIVVSHNLECIHHVADHVVLLTGGGAVTVGAPHQLLISDEPPVRAFTRSWRLSMERYAGELYPHGGRGAGDG